MKETVKLKQSGIATSHYYYVSFFDCKDISSITEITSLFKGKVNIEPISSKNKDQFHFQVLIDEPFGSERILANNLVRQNDKNYYRYDFYVGYFTSKGKKIFFLCYAYNRIKKHLVEIFEKKNITPSYHKPLIKKVLNHMEEGLLANDIKQEKNLNLQIIKYTAAVTSEANANKINIIGANPLNSRVYNILKQNGVGLTVTSMKLKCSKLQFGDIELSFDRLGNCRFWIKSNGAEIAVPMLPIVFNFFDNISAIKEDEYLSRYTLLEEE